MVKQGFVVSDLHLFSRRSCGEDLLLGIRQRLPELDLFVFNGDTFDLAWTDRSCVADVITDALQLVEEIILSSPHCHFYFLFGNHDCAPALVDGINALVDRYPNLTSKHDYLRLGSNIFLHGDVCNYQMDQAGLRKLRERYARVVPRTAFAQAVYQLIIYSGLNRVAYFTHPRGTMISRIYHYLESSSPEVLTGVKRIFFGHTHAPFSQKDRQGVEFVNTGSAIKGLRANFTEFQVEGE